MKTKIQLLLLLMLFLNISLCYGENDIQNPIYDFAKATETGCYLARIETDFNNDGRNDIACSSTNLWGNAGGPWFIYLQKTNGKYFLLGDLFFHPKAFHIQADSKGKCTLTVYIRGGAQEGILFKYGISINGIKESGSLKFYPNPDNPSDNKEFERLFSYLNQHPLAEYCRVEDYLDNRKNTLWQMSYE